MTTTNDMNSSDLSRLERKLDKLTDAVSKLILLEERQITQASRLHNVETRLETNERKLDAHEKNVDKWINRGIGVWVVCGLLFSVLVVSINFLKKGAL